MGLKEQLQRSYANVSLMYIKSNNFHYNVVGPTFLSIHKLFEKQYEFFHESADIIGELLKKEKWEINPNTTWFVKHGSVKEANGENGLKEMVSSQLNSFKKLKIEWDLLARAEQSVTIADAFTTLLHELDKQI
jgi:starvation-inducible DNA-binding protein